MATDAPGGTCAGGTRSPVGEGARGPRGSPWGKDGLEAVRHATCRWRDMRLEGGTAARVGTGRQPGEGWKDPIEGVLGEEPVGGSSGVTRGVRCVFSFGSL